MWQTIFDSIWASPIAEIQMFGPIAIILVAVVILFGIGAVVEGILQSIDRKHKANKYTYETIYGKRT